MFDEALAFIKDESEHLTKSMSKMHHSVVSQFLTFKRRNEEIVREREVLLQRWRTCEMALAFKSPLAEAFYGLQE